MNFPEKARNNSMEKRKVKERDVYIHLINVGIFQNHTEATRFSKCYDDPYERKVLWFIFRLSASACAE